MVMEAVKALYLIKNYVTTSGAVRTRNLDEGAKGEILIKLSILCANDFHKADLYEKHKNSADFKPNGKVYNAMVLVKGSPANKNPKESQRPVFRSNEDLLWPLSAPWQGSYIISSNPARDFPRHGIYAAMEVEVVDMYRQRMINSSSEISMLRRDISELLGSFYPPSADPFQYPDGLNAPSEEEFSQVADDDIDALERSERSSASYERYAAQVQEIIKFCGKQPVMLAHPSGSRDSAVVRDAFDDFIKVSGQECRFTIEGLINTSTIDTRQKRPQAY